MRGAALAHTLLTVVREFLVQNEVSHQPVVVGVSGGADSVALLLALQNLSLEFRLTLTVAHFDHRIRASSADDAEWVRQLAAQWKLPYEIGRAEDTEASADSREATARQRRYQFLTNVVQQRQAAWLAVAHTRDDQVETVLHHIARGTGLRGLMGIPAIRRLTDASRIMRPLLDVSREDVLTFLAERGQEFRQDETNAQTVYTRNRIRHEVLPYLRKTLNPQIDEALLRLALQTRLAEEALESAAHQILKEAVTDQSPQTVRLKLAALSAVPQAVLTTALVELWTQQAWPRQNMSQSHWLQLAQMLQTGSASGLTLPGRIQASIRGQVLQLQSGSEPVRD